MDVQRVTGRLCDDHFNKPENFLIYPVNSIACNYTGAAKDLNAIYAHENVYSRRQRLYNLSRAVMKCRDEPGSLIVQPPHQGDMTSPHLIACVTQFGWGSSIDVNEIAKQSVSSSRDKHYVAGLIQDTTVNRRQYFQSCMKKLTTLAMGHKDVEKLILPEGIGCSGKVNDEWEDNYLPVIRAMAGRLRPFGIQTVLVSDGSPCV